MNLEITVNGACSPNGGHVFLTVTKNGTQSKNITLEKADFFFEPEEYETVLATLLRSFLKEQGFTKNTPLSQLKTAIEAKVFKL